MASATSAGSPRIRVMPAVCMATSVPVAMAMPISAAASAGASLMPSPTMATTSPARAQAGDRGGLVLRQDLGLDGVDAERRRRRRRRRPWLSPVSMTVRDAERVQRGDGGGAPTA